MQKGIFFLRIFCLFLHIFWSWIFCVLFAYFLRAIWGRILDLGGNLGSNIDLGGNLEANIGLGRGSQALGWVGSRL